MYIVHIKELIFLSIFLLDIPASIQDLLKGEDKDFQILFAPPPYPPLTHAKGGGGKLAWGGLILWEEWSNTIMEPEPLISIKDYKEKKWKWFEIFFSYKINIIQDVSQ